ncbi:hypothetical protein V1519DRAFT_446884 [Lipomyces tetrasporus]
MIPITMYLERRDTPVGLDQAEADVIITSATGLDEISKEVGDVSMSSREKKGGRRQDYYTCIVSPNARYLFLVDRYKLNRCW